MLGMQRAPILEVVAVENPKNLTGFETRQQQSKRVDIRVGGLPKFPTEPRQPSARMVGLTDAPSLRCTGITQDGRRAWRDYVNVQSS